MKSKFLTAVVAGLVIAAVGAAPAAAQSNCTTNNCTLTHKVKVTIPDMMKMIFDKDSTALTAPALTDFGVDSTATIPDLGALNISVQSNRKYQITLAANSANWTAPAGVTKPAGDLSWTINGGTNWTPVTTTATNILGGTNNPAFKTTSPVATVGWQTKWHFVNDLAGDYSLVMTFTLAGQ